MFSRMNEGLLLRVLPSSASELWLPFEIWFSLVPGHGSRGGGTVVLGVSL